MSFRISRKLAALIGSRQRGHLQIEIASLVPIDLPPFPVKLQMGLSFNSAPGA
jgi:hypothetical protein